MNSSGSEAVTFVTRTAPSESDVSTTSDSGRSAWRAKPGPNDRKVRGLVRSAAGSRQPAASGYRQQPLLSCRLELLFDGLRRFDFGWSRRARISCGEGKKDAQTMSCV